MIFWREEKEDPLSFCRQTTTTAATAAPMKTLDTGDGGQWCYSVYWSHSGTPPLRRQQQHQGPNRQLFITDQRPETTSLRDERETPFCPSKITHAHTVKVLLVVCVFLACRTQFLASHSPYSRGGLFCLSLSSH